MTSLEKSDFKIPQCRDCKSFLACSVVKCNQCVHCRQYLTRYYTVRELEFFRQFASRSFPLLTCVDCYSAVGLISTRARAQKDRETHLLNRINYFGVLDVTTAQDIFVSYVARKNNVHAAGIFMWEFQIPHPIRLDQRNLIVAVTHILGGVQYRRSIPSDARGFDKYTTYIVCGPDGTYYVAYGIQKFQGAWTDDFKTLCHRGLVSAGKSLPEALASIERTHTHFEHRECNCEPISKYAVLESKTKSTKFTPWSLQHMTAFYIRNQSFNFQYQVLKESHQYCRQLIVGSADHVRDNCTSNGWMGAATLCKDPKIPFTYCISR